MLAPDDQRGQRLAERALDLLQRQYGPGYCYGDITVSELMDFYMVQRRPFWSPGTARTKKSSAASIASALGDVMVREITGRKLREVTTQWQDAGLSVATIHERVCCLKTALNEAVREGILDESPARYFRNPRSKPRLPVVLDMATVHRAAQRLEPPQMRMLVLVALATGLRRGELVALTWADINFDTGELRALYAMTDHGVRTGTRQQTKTGTRHSIVIDDWTLAELKRWRKAPERQAILGRGRNSKWVFVKWRDGTRPFTPRAATLLWQESRERVGLGGLSLHDMRHIHATAALAAGIPVHAVSNRLGLVDPTYVIRTYGHAIPAHDRHIADAMGAVFAQA